MRSLGTQPDRARSRVRRVALGTVVACWLTGLPAAAEPSPAAAEPPPGVSAPQSSELAGTWRLDIERSEPPGPMLKALDVPWIMRSLAGRSRPTLVIADHEGGLRVVQENLLGSQERLLTADGRASAGEDQLGRPFRERSWWAEDGALHVERELELGGTRNVWVLSVWQREGPLLVATVDVRVEDGPPLRVRRVFAPQDAEAR